MSAIWQLCQLVGLGLMLLLPLANPLTTVALFLGMSGNMSVNERHQQSLMTSVYVFLIMMVAFYAGQWIMNTFGISIPGLRIAGGLIVSYIGFRMLFPQQHHEMPEVISKTAEMHHQPSANIAFIPLAMPSTAGPGTIAMIISSASSINDHVDGIAPWVIHVGPVITFLLIAIILWGCLRSADMIMKLLGKGSIEAISRLMGFLLVCIGVQFVINGVLDISANGIH